MMVIHTYLTSVLLLNIEVQLLPRRSASEIFQGISSIEQFLLYGSDQSSETLELLRQLKVKDTICCCQSRIRDD